MMSQEHPLGQLERFILSGSMSNKLRKIAKLVEESERPEKLQAELTTRPLRYAFIIKEDLPLSHAAEILEYNSVIWGGYFNYLVPTDGVTISEEWWDNLEIYGPDIIILCGEPNSPKKVISEPLYLLIEKELQPFAIYSWTKWGKKNDLLEQHGQGYADRWFDAMPMVPILQHILDRLSKPVEEGKSNVRIPTIETIHPLYIPLVAQVGIAKEIYKTGYIDQFKAEEIVFESDDLEEFLNKLSQLKAHATPLSLTRRYTTNTFRLRHGQVRPEGLSIVLADSKPISDICIFWNLRLTESLFARDSKELILPFDIFRSNKNLELLASVLKENEFWHSRKIAILSHSAAPRRLKRLVERLQSYIPHADIKIVNNLLPVADFRVRGSTEAAEISVESGLFSFRRPNLEFQENVKSGHWAVDVDFARQHELPWFSTLNDTLCCKNRFPSYSGYWLRYQYGRLCSRAWGNTKFVTGCMLDAKEAFQIVFQDREFQTNLSDKHPFTEGLLNLLGSTKILETPGVRNLFWKMQKGTTYTFDGLKPHLKLGREDDKFIDDLIRKNILLRGMEFTCEYCGYTRWYPLSILNEKVQCVGCLKYVNPPSKAPIVFKLNELVARAVSQGSIPVLLTKRAIDKHSVMHRLELFGLVVEKENDHSEIDFVTTFDGHLLLAECKDYKEGFIAKERAKAFKQLKSLSRIAEAVNAPIVVFSTLLPFDSPDIHDFADYIRRLNKKGNVAVHLLSLSKMGFVDLKNPSKILKHPDLHYAETG